MPVPSLTEAREMETAIDRVISELQSTNGSPSTSAQYTKPPLPPLTLILNNQKIPATGLMTASASATAMTLSVPGFGWQRPNPAHVASIRKFSFGILMHERTHVHQAIAHPTAFVAAVAKGKVCSQTLTKPSRQWLADYYSIPEELEAHAVQLAAEVWLTSKGLNKVAFDKEVASTDIYRWIAVRMPVQSTTPGVAQWWAAALTEAWRSYQTWHPPMTAPGTASTALPRPPAAPPSAAAPSSDP